MFTLRFSSFLLALSILPLISSQNIRAFKSSAQLPSARSYVGSSYDGGDQIYLFGGYVGDYPPGSDDIAIYTISTDSLQVVGKLPVTTLQAKAVPDSNGDIIVFTQYTQVYKFEKATRNVSLVATIPLQGDWWDGFIQISNTSVLFFTEASSAVNMGSTMVFEFNLDTYEITQHPVVPEPLTYINGFWDREDSVYLFGETYPDNRHPVIFKYSLSGKNYTEVLSDFPGMRYQTSVVWDGQNATLVGGYATRVSTDGVTVYNPSSNVAQFVQVDNWIPNMDWNFHSTSAVYVDQLKRIYMFGGWAYRFFPDIWFLERSL